MNNKNTTELLEKINTRVSSFMLIYNDIALNIQDELQTLSTERSEKN